LGPYLIDINKKIKQKTKQNKTKNNTKKQKQKQKRNLNCSADAYGRGPERMAGCHGVLCSGVAAFAQL
jgi:hypothetical protein